jgi:hypothetical protein
MSTYSGREKKTKGDTLEEKAIQNRSQQVIGNMLVKHTLSKIEKNKKQKKKYNMTYPFYSMAYRTYKEWEGLLKLPTFIVQQKFSWLIHNKSLPLVLVVPSDDHECMELKQQTRGKEISFGIPLRLQYIYVFLPRITP